VVAQVPAAHVATGRGPNVCTSISRTSAADPKRSCKLRESASLSCRSAAAHRAGARPRRALVPGHRTACQPAYT